MCNLMKQSRLALVLLFTMGGAAQIANAQRQLFEYDAKLPLDLKQKQLEES